MLKIISYTTKDLNNVHKHAVEYTSSPKPELLADYNYVKEGSAQIVDVRPFAELSGGRIPQSISIDAAKALFDRKLKDENGLKSLFNTLSKDKPVIVYSDNYYQTSLLWYAMKLMGYESRI